MTESVDKKKAEMLLKVAWFATLKHPTKPLTKIAQYDNISKIILGNHLTFRYMLLTALLAKATNNNINALALQTSSSLSGAYDARSLCHQVVVPFERKYMSCLLGGSNEPFLNKPARYKEISKATNAVRKGNNERLHNILIEILNYANEKPNDTRKMLCVACYFISKRKSKQIENIKFVKDVNSFEFLNRIIAFVSVCHEGETTVLTLGAILSCLLEKLNVSYQVKVHPSNQCGASSKEICDIDVFYNDKFAFGVEVKDKIYSLQDVEHAVNKVKSSGNNCLFFVTGLRGTSSDIESKEFPGRLLNEGFILAYYDIMDVIKMAMALGMESANFYKYLIKHSKEARIKDTTKNYLNKIFSIALT